MNRPSLAARLACTALFGASLLLAACGDDGDGGDAAGGSSTDSPLSGLLSGFGTPGASNPTGPAADAGAGGGAGTGTGGTEAASDAGIVTPEVPAEPVTDNCSRVCARIAECLPEGCPNFDRLPDDAQNETVADCESKCDDVSDEYVDAVRRLSCAQVTEELLKAPDVAAFCALVPATEDVCDQFCDLITECTPAFPRESCALACLYAADGVACVVENGCDSGACAQYFPEGG